MTQMRTRWSLAAAALFWAGWMLLASPTSATLDIQKAAKAKSFPAQNCLYCHNEKLPKKEAVTHNERGQWLISEKEKRKAAAVDASWLKDYPGDKK